MEDERDENKWSKTLLPSPSVKKRVFLRETRAAYNNDVSFPTGDPIGRRLLEEDDGIRSICSCVPPGQRHSSTSPLLEYDRYMVVCQNRRRVSPTHPLSPPDQIDLARLKNWSAGNAVLLEYSYRAQCYIVHAYIRLRAYFFLFFSFLSFFLFFFFLFLLYSVHTGTRWCSNRTTTQTSF